MANRKQSERVLAWLEHRGPITVREAVTDLGVMSLPARIMELRREGYAITRTWKTSNNGARYGVYELIKEA